MGHSAVRVAFFYTHTYIYILYILYIYFFTIKTWKDMNELFEHWRWKSTALFCSFGFAWMQFKDVQRRLNVIRDVDSVWSQNGKSVIKKWSRHVLYSRSVTLPETILARIYIYSAWFYADRIWMDLIRHSFGAVLRCQMAWTPTTTCKWCQLPWVWASESKQIESGPYFEPWSWVSPNGHQAMSPNPAFPVTSFAYRFLTSLFLPSEATRPQCPRNISFASICRKNTKGLMEEIHTEFLFSHLIYIYFPAALDRFILLIFMP